MNKAQELFSALMDAGEVRVWLITAVSLFTV